MRLVFHALLGLSLIAASASAASAANSARDWSAEVERTGSPVDQGDDLRGVGFLLAVIGAVVVVVAILLLDGGDDEPVSP